MTAKRLDLDAALAESDQADEPLVVTFFDQEWELPGTLPAAVVLRIHTWQEDGLLDDDGDPTEELTVGQCLGLLRDMVPVDILAAWCDLGLGVDRYAAAVDHIMKSYSLVMQAEQMAAGKPRAPKGANRATKRASAKSSTTGRPSKRTSPASTGSRSPRR